MVQRKWLFRILLVIFGLGLIYWFGLRTDPAVQALNQAIRGKGSLELRNYPYAFRVLRLDKGVALMTTPRSPEVPVYRMIGALYPNLGGKAPNDPDFVAAQKALAQVQAEARQIVLDQPGVSGVKWELDRNWLIVHGIQPN
ncbi:MAG: hypothetical protein Q8K43_00765 [Sulfurimicrobium sp.]|nr:hypothetical protein [Sulfurimicrobium sp.]